MKLLPDSTIAKKIVMAISGILILGFLASHMAGNFLLFVSKEAFNEYAHTLTSNPLIYLAEVVLLLIFIYHIGSAIVVTMRNRKARPDNYESKRNLGKSTLMSRTMMVTGSIILIFLIFHIWTFKFGPDAEVPAYRLADGSRDLYKLVAERFSNPGYSLFYIFAMCCMGFHIGHAIQSACRTLGLSQGGYLKAAKCGSLGVALLFVFGFSSMPIYFFCKGSSDVESKEKSDKAAMHAPLVPGVETEGGK